MRDTRLIMVDGIPGSGKSTTAQTIALQLKSNEIPYEWMHEEMKDHPLDNEYEVRGSIEKSEIDAFIEVSLQRWRNLMSEIMKQEKVYVTESFLYQSMSRILFMANADMDKIMKYVEEFYQIIKPANPVIVYLYKKDVRKSFDNIYTVRGEEWKKAFIGYSEKYLYFKENGLEGAEGTLHMWSEYQRFNNKLFDECPFSKLKFESSSNEWESIYRKITDLLSIHYYPASEVKTIEPELICGSYQVYEDNPDATIDIKYIDGILYCEAFWPFMRMVPISFNRFQLRSFPIELTFIQNSEGKVTHAEINGNYDWRIMGSKLPKIS